jgi:hypothetical protein
MPIAAAVLLTTGALLAATAATATASKTPASTNPLVCSYYAASHTAQTTFVFTRSTDIAIVNYVGERCLTITFEGGPDNPNPTARTIGSVTYVDVDSKTRFWMSKRRATIKAVRPGDELLSLTATGKVVLRAVKVVILPKGAKLPE